MSTRTDMYSGGTAEAGFTIAFDEDARKILVRGWGFWSPAIASDFGNAVREACKNRPSESAVNMDLTDLKPMREEGQLTFSLLARTLPALLTGPIVLTTSSQLTRLQLLRIIGAAGSKRPIQVVSTAEKGTSSQGSSST